MAPLAAVAKEQVEAIVEPFPAVERSPNPLGCYFLVRRKIFAQIATVIDGDGDPVTMVVVKPTADDREALLASGHPYFSRGRWDDQLGRIAVLIEEDTDWGQLTELIIDSYRQIAPKKLIAQLDALGRDKRPEEEPT